VILVDIGHDAVVAELWREEGLQGLPVDGEHGHRRPVRRTLLDLDVAEKPLLQSSAWISFDRNLRIKL
jgi:hypothetical protein